MHLPGYFADIICLLLWNEHKKSTVYVYISTQAGSAAEQNMSYNARWYSSKPVVTYAIASWATRIAFF